MKTNRNSILAAYIVGVIALLFAPTFLYPVLVMKILCYALFACAFNLLFGYTGLLSFGHAAFFGAAAYVTAYSLKVLQLQPLVAILLGTSCSAVLGLLIGSLAIRRQGIYFSMITLALGQLVFFVFLQAPFTGGEDGLRGITRGSIFGFDLSDDSSLYFVVVAITVSAFALIHRITLSPFGQTLLAIRENEPRAISLGYDVNQYKLLAFVLSAGLAGLAGATKTLVFKIASLSDAHWHTSGEVILMSLLGGTGSVLGPVVGSSIIVTLQTQLADKVGSLVTVITGTIFIFCVLMFRRGIVGEIAAIIPRRTPTN